MNNVVHLVEFGGKGGVFQHAYELAIRLSKSVGVKCVVHTASDHEHLEENSQVQLCRCVNWHRGSKGSVRGLRIVLGFYGSTLPHVLFASKNSVLWVQGLFKLPLTFSMLLVGRATARKVVFSPHNLFLRRGGRGRRSRLIERAVKTSTCTVVYNRNDEQSVKKWKVADCVVMPLWQYVPDARPEIDERWFKLRSENYTCGFFGQIRADKNLPLLISAAAAEGYDLLVAGPDGGDLDNAEAASRSAGGRVQWVVDYLPLDELVAAMKCVDVVVCPYSIASQSGVVELARRVGALTIGSELGGLGRQVDMQVKGDVTVASLRAALRQSAERHQAKRGRTDSCIAQPLSSDQKLLEAIIC